MKEQAQTFQLTAKTLSGLEPILANELADLGAEEVNIGTRVVEFQGNLAMVYKANLHCRTALRILIKLTDFVTEDADQLYAQTMEFPWEQYFGVNDTFAIDATLIRSTLTHTQYAALKVKDAIADRFRKISNNERPSVDVMEPTVRINVHISSNYCTLSLDSSGESLHRRGYKLGMHEAPMSEVLAAGLLMLAGWDKKTKLMDPMCGSGTFLTEAALMATNTAPGMFRKQFGFERWKTFNENLWRKVKGEAKEAIKPLEVEISGSDFSGPNVEAARQNIENCGFEEQIKIKKIPFEKLEAPGVPCFVIMNPPYGERLNPAQLNGLYAMIGTKLKNDFQGSEAWIISPNVDAMKNVGLKPSRKITVYNGPLECKFQNYKMFRGSLKEFKSGDYEERTVKE
jgi:putative N6-adenine-specific DNA methylase